MKNQFYKLWVGIFILVLLNSCSLLIPSYSPASYTIQQPYPYPWLDMTKGTWAIYDFEAPFGVAGELDKEVYQNFEELLGDRLIEASLDDELLIDKSLNANALNKETLKNLAKTSKVDYIIFIKIQRGKETNYTEPNLSYNLDKGSEPYTDVYYRDCFANIKIYSLQEAKRIFNKSCKAELKVNDKQPIDFSPSEEKMMKKAYRKLFKNLKAETKH